MSFRPWLWLIAVAFVLLALWGWRELGMRVEKERGASRDAEIRQLQEENTHLKAQISKLETDLGAGTAMFDVAGPRVGSARVFIYAEGHGLLVTTDVPKGKYVLRTDAPDAPPIATIAVPASGEKALMLDHLPPQQSIKSFTLTSR